MQYLTYNHASFTIWYAKHGDEETHLQADDDIKNSTEYLQLCINIFKHDKFLYQLTKSILCIFLKIVQRIIFLHFQNIYATIFISHTG